LVIQTLTGKNQIISCLKANYSRTSGVLQRGAIAREWIASLKKQGARLHEKVIDESTLG
jgi:hypothetical protein